MKLDISCLCEKGGMDFNTDRIKYYEADNGTCLMLLDAKDSHYGAYKMIDMLADQIIGGFGIALEGSPNMALVPQFQAVPYIAACELIKNSLSERDAAIGFGAATVVTNGNATRVANIGDAQVYIYKEGRLIAATKAHTLAQIVADCGFIPPEEARFNKGCKCLYKVLTADNTIPPDVGLYDKQLEQGDYIIMCNSFFWRSITEAEMEGVLEKGLDASAALDEMKSIVLKNYADHRNRRDKSDLNDLKQYAAQIKEINEEKGAFFEKYLEYCIACEKSIGGLSGNGRSLPNYSAIVARVV